MNIEIRPADLSICIEIAVSGKALWEELGYGSLVSYERDSVLATCNDLMENGVLLAAFDGDKMVGYVGAVPSSVFFNLASTMLVELFWWVEPDYRSKGVGIKLIQALETKAEEMEARYISIGLHRTADEGKAGEMVRDMGFIPTERTYVKEASWVHSVQSQV